MSVRVLLAEDQAMVRGAIAALLTLEEDIEIVAEASRGDDVIEVGVGGHDRPHRKTLLVYRRSQGIGVVARIDDDRVLGLGIAHDVAVAL